MKLKKNVEKNFTKYYFLNNPHNNETVDSLRLIKWICIYRIKSG